MAEEEKTKNEEEFDICVSCGKVTSHKKTDNIVFRSGYIEGSGQLCFTCNQTRKLHKTGSYDTVSYTHLTLPTILRV